MASPPYVSPIHRAQAPSRRVALPDRQLQWLASTANRAGMGTGAYTPSTTAASETARLIRSAVAGPSTSPLRAWQRLRLPRPFPQILQRWRALLLIPPAHLRLRRPLPAAAR